MLGSSLALFGGVMMGCVGVAGKFGALAGLSPFQMLAAQVSLLVPVSAAALYLRHGSAGFVPVRPWRLVVRTVSGFVYFLSFYASLKGISVADALVLESTNPFFAMLITTLLFRERPSGLSVGLALVAFGGVCLILLHHGAQGLLNPYSLLGLLAGLGRAAGSVATGVAGRSEPPERIIFYYASGMLLFSAVALPFNWHAIQGTEWWILIAPAILFVPQNLAYTVANRLIPAYLVGALFYSAILVGVVADRWLWDTEIGVHGLVGTLLVVAAGLGLLVDKRRGPSPKPPVD
ncbi:MAG: DMT family transporter [Myxococcota bacterium]